MPPGAPGYGQYANGESGYGKRQVPGAPPPYAGGAGGDTEKKGNRKKKGGKNKDSTSNAVPGENGAVENAYVNGNTNGTPTPKGKKGGQQSQQQRVTVTPPPPPAPEPEPASPVADGAMDTIAKRVRNLNKKVCDPKLFLYSTSQSDHESAM
jgi:translation initiation factor 2A